MKAKLLFPLAALAMAGCQQASAPQLTDAQLAAIDKVEIADLLTRYYAHLGHGESEAFGDFFTDDAVFDVNGIVANGKDEIAAIYAGIPNNPDRGKFHMIISNPVIDVDGDSATASVLWTGVRNAELQGPPVLVEQGRELDRLVRRDGKWLIEKRVVIADSNLPESHLKTYDPDKGL